MVRDFPVLRPVVVSSRIGSLPRRTPMRPPGQSVDENMHHRGDFHQMRSQRHDWANYGSRTPERSEMSAENLLWLAGALGHDRNRPLCHAHVTALLGRDVAAHRGGHRLEPELGNFRSYFGKRQCRLDGSVFRQVHRSVWSQIYHATRNSGNGRGDVPAWPQRFKPYSAFLLWSHFWPSLVAEQPSLGLFRKLRPSNGSEKCAAELWA